MIPSFWRAVVICTGPYGKAVYAGYSYIIF